MTHDETSPRARSGRSYAVALALACAATACSVALHPAGAPTRPDPAPTASPRPVVTPTSVPPPTPSPIARLAHLEVPADTTGDAGSTAAAAAPSLTSGGVTFERRGDLLVAPAQINGRPLGDVLLDTGAGATFIDQRLADEMQLPEMITASTGGSRANREASIREIHGLTIGGLSLAADRTFVVDLGGADPLVGSRLAGVIGFPTVGATPFTLDFTTGTFTVHTDATFEPPAGVPAEALRIDQGLPFVEATLTDGTAVWLLLDSASSGALMVWRGFAKQHPGALAPSTIAAATEGAVRESELRSLRLLGEKYARMPVTVEDAPARPWHRARVVGRIGMALLRDLRITVHPATERIWVERPRPADGR